MVTCAALGVRADMLCPVPPYARLLTSTQRGRDLLREMDGKTRVPILTKPAAVKDLPAPAGEIFDLNAAARDFYVLGYEAAEERTGSSDWRASPVTV